MPKVFLGGTYNNSDWRSLLIPKLEVEYFNPVVDDWTPDCQEEEIRQRELCDYCLYVITPKMTGVYSIAEVIDDSNKRPDKTVFYVITKDGKDEFTEGQLKSLKSVGAMVKENGGTWCQSLTELLNKLNGGK